MLQWILGEKRCLSTTISESSGAPFSISSANYAIYDVETEETVLSGVASISNYTCYTFWQPEESGVYVAEFAYNIGLVEGRTRQVFEVLETL